MKVKSIARGTPFARAILVAALAGACGGAAAQSTAAEMAYAVLMKKAFAQSSSTSPYAANAAAINSLAASDADCAALGNAGVAQAQASVRASMPPDPTTVIQNTTCFLDVMSIKIPTTGFGILDFLIGTLNSFLKTTACKASSSYWNNLKAQISGGSYSQLMSQVFNSTGPITVFTTPTLPSYPVPPLTPTSPMTPTAPSTLPSTAPSTWSSWILKMIP